MKAVYLSFFSFSILIASCGGNFDLESENELREPYVVSVSPADGAMSEAVDSITAVLSRPINPDTVTNESFFISSADQADITAMDTESLVEAVEKGEVMPEAGVMTVSDDGLEITWVPDSPLSPQTTYQIVLTPEIQTSDFYPFNQTPGQTQSAFVSRFTLTSFAGEAEASPSEGETKKPEFLLINEVLYDSAESDSDGNVFVELYGGAGGDLAGYVLRLVNGADGAATDEIVFPVGSLIPDDGFFVVADSKTGNASETNVANADFIDNFDPQNGPDSIQLLNASGVLIDVVGYGEGLFASDADDNLLYEGSPAQTAGVGKSLSRVAATDTGNNSADFVANETPSPGNGDVSGPENSNAVASSEQTDISIDSTADAEDSIPPDFNAVHFTEVVTDPQQDWNDTLGGNGIAFDSTVGNGTVGTTDEWVEIQNGTLDSVDLTLWRLEMLDGTDEMEYFSSPSASLIFTAGGDGGNFQPDEFLVIGNPPGDLKNVVTLQLFDESDFLVDELVIDDANATGTADESYQIMDDGNWGMGEASIGF